MYALQVGWSNGVATSKVQSPRPGQVSDRILGRRVIPGARTHRNHAANAGAVRYTYLALLRRAGTIRWRPHNPVVKGSSFGIRAGWRQSGINPDAWPKPSSRLR